MGDWDFLMEEKTNDETTLSQPVASRKNEAVKLNFYCRHTLTTAMRPTNPTRQMPAIWTIASACWRRLQEGGGEPESQGANGQNIEDALVRVSLFLGMDGTE